MNYEIDDAYSLSFLLNNFNTNQTDEMCLLSHSPLEDNCITLECNHKFRNS